MNLSPRYIFFLFFAIHTHIVTATMLTFLILFLDPHTVCELLHLPPFTSLQHHRRAGARNLQEKWGVNMKQKKATHIANGVDVDVVLGAIRVRHKRLDQELAQDTLNMLNLNWLCGALSNPRLGLSPGLVQSQETALASPLDQLVRLRDKLSALLEEPWVGDLSLVQDILNALVLGEVQRSQPWGRIVLV